LLGESLTEAFGFEETAVSEVGDVDGGDLGGWSVTRTEEGGALGLERLRVSEAGGPTGTIREPNSTPIVTSWWGVKRPSQRRTVNCICQFWELLMGWEKYAGFTSP
jgi:hypothetical protein